MTMERQGFLLKFDATETSINQHSTRNQQENYRYNVECTHAGNTSSWSKLCMRAKTNFKKFAYSCAQGYREVKKAPRGLKYELNETYFLTDPDTFIYDHRPMLDEWQLLARPVTFSEFKVCSIHFFQSTISSNFTHIIMPAMLRISDRMRKARASMITVTDSRTCF